MQFDLFKKEEPEVEVTGDTETKICKQCKETKSVVEFRTAYWAKSGSRIYCNQCLECHRSNARILYFLKKDNTAPEDGVCEACGDDTKPLHLDHNHITGEFRGWVCEGCNHSMGKSNDDPDKLIKQAEYLRARTPSKTEANSSED